METFINSIRNISKTNEILCNICSIQISNPDMVPHTMAHYYHSGFSAEICIFCKRSVNTDSLEPILEHMIFNHKMKSDCPMCQRKFNSMDDLYYHLENSMKPVYHCSNKNCLMMSDKKNSLIDHFKETKHQKKLFFEETVFICKYKEKIKIPLLNQSKKKKMSHNKENHLTKKRNFFKNHISKPPLKTIQLNNSNDNKTDKIFIHLEDNENLNEKSIKTFHQFKYSERVFDKYASALNMKSADNIKNKLKNLNQFTMSIGYVNKIKRYICETCNYYSTYSNMHIKRHIFSFHCGLNNSDREILFSVSRNDSDIKLLSDKEMIDKINIQLKSKKFNPIPLLTNSDDDMEYYKCTYSKRVLDKFVAVSNPRLVENFHTKLKYLHTFLFSTNEKGFTCVSCDYYSLFYQAIKRHLIVHHCNISQNNHLLILKVINCNFDSKLKQSDEQMIDDINNDISLKLLKAQSLLSDSEDDGVDISTDPNETNSFNKLKMQLIKRIDFQYSVRILNSICKMEKCPENYESLKMKMNEFINYSAEIYSRHKNFLYTCSNCNWYSRYSINEVVRHVLDFHLNMQFQPKLSKQIIDVCCTMDKNNRLLSDDAICAMGWKGRKIRI